MTVTVDLRLGDCLDVLPTLPDASMDSIVTDPPYGLSFMGKDWDHGVPGVPFWEAALRVAKPGAHLLAFGGRRTEHRLACAIEDAGWEIRDKVAWCYAMGFPKSYNVSKVLTNLIPSSLRCACDHHLTYTGLSSQADCLSGCGSHDALLQTAQDSDPTSVPSQGDVLEHSHGGRNVDDPDTRQVHSLDHSPIVPLSIGDCVLLLGHLSTGSQSEHSRLSDMLESMLRAGLLESRRRAFRILGTDDLASDSVLALPYSDAPDSSISRIYHKCQECQGYLAVTGYGTALKPAIEEIIVARKPLEGTVAANVLKWGAGGINIDGCRVGTEGGTARDGKATIPNDAGWQNMRGHGVASLNAGRWPANLIHDGSDEVVELFPVTGPARARRLNGNELKPPRAAYGDYRKRTEGGVDDNGGSASRFFQACPWSDDDRRLYYVSKASKRDRDEGLEEFEAKHVGHYAQDEWSRQHMGNTPDAKRQPVRNTHPTVKPTALMRYLVRLVTPPGGVVLDPFMGSGSTGKAARLEGFGFVGIELERESYDIAEARIAWADKQALQEQPTLDGLL